MNLAGQSREIIQVGDFKKGKQATYGTLAWAVKVTFESSELVLSIFAPNVGIVAFTCILAVIYNTAGVLGFLDRVFAL